MRRWLALLVLSTSSPVIGLSLTYFSADLEWTVTYVGSADSSKHDQQLTSVMVGPIPRGDLRFDLEAPAPDLSKIPEPELVGVTVLLLTCLYSGREFLRIGYYVHITYEDDAYIQYRKSVEASPEADAEDVMAVDAQEEEEEDDDDAMDEEDDEEDDDNGDAGDEQPSPAQARPELAAAPAPTAQQPQKAQQKQKILSPQEFKGIHFNPSLLRRSILRDESGVAYTRARAFDVDWNHPWNATLKKVYQAGTHAGKPAAIDRGQWLQYFMHNREALNRSQTDPLPPFEQEWAYQCWLTMLRSDPGHAGPNRSFDWLEDLDLPREEDMISSQN